MNKQQIGRLAMRQEGGNWNAYYAMPANMEQSQPIFIGSIRMGAVIGNPQRKAAFMDMMRDVVADIIEKESGVRPSWGGEVPAPEHERSGNA
jgi:hypothetical protein